MKLFKRYANRKLYSTETSKYVTVGDILDLSHTNDVLVIDNKTKRDITEYVLTLARAQLARVGEAVPKGETLKPTPLFSPGIIGDILDAIVSNAARDVKQAKGGAE